MFSVKCNWIPERLQYQLEARTTSFSLTGLCRQNRLKSCSIVQLKSTLFKAAFSPKSGSCRVLNAMFEGNGFGERIDQNFLYQLYMQCDTDCAQSVNSLSADLTASSQTFKSSSIITLSLLILNLRHDMYSSIGLIKNPSLLVLL